MGKAGRIILRQALHEGMNVLTSPLWPHDPHVNVTRWHEDLRERITAEQRRAVLRIKDVRHRRPAYPDQVGGPHIYTAAVDDGVRPRQFATWLASRGLPATQRYQASSTSGMTARSPRASPMRSHSSFGSATAAAAITGT